MTTAMRQAWLRCTVLVVAFALVLSFDSAQAQSSGSDITCYPPQRINGSLEFHDCDFPLTERYAPPGSTLAYGVGFNVPSPMPGNGTLPVVMTWDPYGDQTRYPNNNGAAFGVIVVKNVNDYYPTEQHHMVGNVAPLGWGMYYLGNSPAERTAATMDYILDTWGSSVDQGDGITLSGKSYGGAAAINAPLMLRPDLRKRVTKIFAVVPPLGILQPGNLYDRTDQVMVAWRGADLNLFDHQQHADLFKFTYVAVKAASNDSTVRTDIPWLIDFCNKGVPCYAKWGPFDHSWPPPDWLNMVWDEWFDSPDMNFRLDDPFVIAITHATSDRAGPVGWINWGWRWRNTSMVANATSMSVAVGYLAHTNIAPGVDDQPAQPSAQITLRPRSAIPQLRHGEMVRWSIGDASGQSVVLVNGEVSVPISLQTSVAMRVLTVTKTGETIPGC